MENERKIEALEVIEEKMHYLHTLIKQGDSSAKDVLRAAKEVRSKLYRTSDTALINNIIESYGLLD